MSRCDANQELAMESTSFFVSKQRRRLADFVTLTKPRVMMLAVFTAIVGLTIAPGDLAPLSACIAVLAIAAGAGAAGVLNMWYDADIDALMRRTARRPLPSGRLGPGEVLAFGLVLAGSSVVVLALATNLVAAGLLAFTILFYVVVYTVWLKRRTPHNIVIGGAAGALPPVIGWAAAQDSLSRGAWVLFGIVFLWQLPHFLAIAWIYREDYARAGFPMLSVIDPDGRSTARQSVIYAAALLPVSLAPTLVGMTGSAYFAGALALSLAFVALAVKFALTRSTPDARRLFFGSITYLPLLWLLMILNRV
jgi:protoheme IX farnesyltransferase